MEVNLQSKEMSVMPWGMEVDAPVIRGRSVFIRNTNACRETCHNVDVS
jgi:hypothetical protein